MAQTITSNDLSPEEQRDSEQLRKYLEENYNMSNDEWWANVQTAFGHLQSILERRPNKTSEEGDSESITAHVARVGALPVVSLLPSGSYASRLTATNEDLPCVAFGTISTQMYVEIFWEAVARVQDEGGKFVVYRVEERLGCFWFNFDGHHFQLLYVQCEDLIRSYPEILDVPDTIVQDVDNHTRGIVEGIKRSTQERTYFSDPASKEAFHYFRAFAIAKGLYTTNQSLTSGRTFKFLDLVKAVNPGSLAAGHSTSYYVSDFLNKLSAQLLSRPHLARPARLDDGGPVGLLRVLQETENESVDFKFGMMEYLQVKVAYWGGSDMACGKWLSMAERRLSKLKERLETSDPRPDTVCIWPQRLVSLESASEGHFYECCYILGLRRQNEAIGLPTSARKAQRWTVQIEGDHETPKEDCSIRTVCMLARELEYVRLRPCTRQWPRPVVAVDRGKNHQDMQGDSQIDDLDKHKRTSKHQKKYREASKTELAIHESHRKLRPASDVLKRLKHDRSLNIDEFKVGYVDRHTDKIQEKPAIAWVRDTTDEEWIPEHRIVYFKRYPVNGEEQLVWDKASKIDRIFKESGNVE